MDYIFVYFLGQRSVSGKHLLSAVQGMMPNTHIVTIFEIRSSTRKLER
jgi:hypothetical protein